MGKWAHCHMSRVEVKFVEGVPFMMIEKQIVLAHLMIRDTRIARILMAFKIASK